MTYGVCLGLAVLGLLLRKKAGAVAVWLMLCGLAGFALLLVNDLVLRRS